MAARVVSITNISHQVVKVLYGETLQSESRTQFPYTAAGEITIVPSASTEVEENRLDLGQIEAFRRKGLITTTTR